MLSMKEKADKIRAGFPLSALIAKIDIMEKCPAGAHRGTSGGNQVSCGAALKDLELLQCGIVENSKIMGKNLKGRLLEIKEQNDIIGDVRGLDLMIGVEFIKPDTKKQPDQSVVAKIRKYCLDNGLILLPCGANYETIRFIAPFTVTKSIIDEALSIFESALKAKL